MTLGSTNIHFRKLKMFGGRLVDLTTDQYDTNILLVDKSLCGMVVEYLAQNNLVLKKGFISS